MKKIGDCEKFELLMLFKFCSLIGISTDWRMYNRPSTDMLEEEVFIITKIKVPYNQPDN